MTIEKITKINLYLRNILFVSPFILASYIIYLRKEYDASQEKVGTYQTERNILGLKFDSLTTKYDSLETGLVSERDHNKKLQQNFDSLKGEFYKKQNASITTNRPILFYNVNQLDSFWQHSRFGYNN